MKFRDLVADARSELGWSLDRAAEEVGLALGRSFSKGSYRHLEALQTFPHDAALFQAVCEVFGFEPEDVLRKIGFLPDTENNHGERDDEREEESYYRTGRRA